MYESNFNRTELKYLLTKNQYLEFFDRISDYVEKDKYYDSKICNIYFDNVGVEMTTHSIEKPLFKQKVRLRSYSVPTLSDDVFLEVKTKFKKVVTKRRIKVCLNEFNNYLETGKYDNKNQIMREIDYLFKYFNLKPFYFLAYDRKSYKAKDNEELRITLDERLRSRQDNLFLNLGDYGKNYFDDDIFIMEIKTQDALPFWLVNSLSDLKVYPVSFSKLGSIFKKELEEKLC